MDTDVLRGVLKLSVSFSGRIAGVASRRTDSVEEDALLEGGTMGTERSGAKRGPGRFAKRMGDAITHV